MNKQAFTIIELLIAMSISSIIALGLFSMFDAIVGTSQQSDTSSESIEIIQAITNLINKDVRMSNNSAFSVDNREDIGRLKFSTQNSLRFNKAIPVDVEYYVDDEGWFVRRESNTNMLYDMDMRLIPNVTELDYLFYDGIEYVEETKASARLIKVNMVVEDNNISVLAARTF